MEYTEFLNLIQEAEDTEQQPPEQAQEVANNVSNLITSAGISLSDNIKAALDNAVKLLKGEDEADTSDLDKGSSDNTQSEGQPDSGRAQQDTSTEGQQENSQNGN